MRNISQYRSLLGILLFLSCSEAHSTDMCRGTKTRLILNMYQDRLIKAYPYIRCIDNCQRIPSCSSFSCNMTDGRCSLFDGSGKSFSEMCKERGYIFLKNSLSCVKLHQGGSPWFKARQTCRKNGADLVVVKDETKQREVAILMMRYQTVWIGLHDQPRTNTFMWVDGSPLVYTAWEPGQPSYSFRRRQEDCVQVSHTTQKEPLWNDARCKYSRKFMCEIDLNVLK